MFGPCDDCGRVDYLYYCEQCGAYLCHSCYELDQQVHDEEETVLEDWDEFEEVG